MDGVRCLIELGCRLVVFVRALIGDALCSILRNLRKTVDIGQMASRIPGIISCVIQAGIDKLKETLKGDDTDAIKAATEELTQLFYKMSEKLYQQQAPQGGAEGCDPNCGGDCGNNGGEYYDADYKVVDEDENK